MWRALGPMTASVRWVASWRVWGVSPVLRDLGVPVMASVAIHAGALGSLFLIAWTVTKQRELLAGSGEVVISFLEPADDVEPERRVEGSSAMDRPAPELPVLSGMSTTGAVALPTLRSPAGNVAASPRLTRSSVADAGVNFAGLGSARALRVVYVVDASGAMVTSLKFVLPELERSIGALAPAQEFQVVFFRSRGGARGGSGYDAYATGEGAKPGLVRATAEARAGASSWARGMMPSGRSVPLEGLRAALAMKPDVVFLLARSIRRSGAEEGWGGGVEEILRELEALNPRDAKTGRRAVVIKTIQFIDDDPSGVMQAIGREHGDDDRSYRILTLEELGAR